ncbi:hypothetical protein ACWEWF_46230, partial [Streptomyces sp. NPDC003857]
MDEALLRSLTPGVLSVLVRRGADFAAAEDAVQQQTHPPQPPTHNPNPKGVAPALGPRNTRLQL